MALIRKDFLFTYDCLATFYSVWHLHTFSDGFITQSFDLNNTQYTGSMTTLNPIYQHKHSIGFNNARAISKADAVTVAGRYTSEYDGIPSDGNVPDY